MNPIFLLPLLLTSCASPIEPFESALNSYAAAAFQGELSSTLTGSALHEAKQSRDLLLELGWSQIGVSRFENTRLVGDRKVVSCLDVSGVSFVDSAGAAVSLARQSDRLLMQVEFSGSNPPLVSRMQEVGTC